MVLAAPHRWVCDTTLSGWCGVAVCGCASFYWDVHLSFVCVCACVLLMCMCVGWNSWNHFGCRVNETLLRQTADAMVATGLSQYGYEYINIDDCTAVTHNHQTHNHIRKACTTTLHIPTTHYHTGTTQAIHRTTGTTTYHVVLLMMSMWFCCS